MITVDIRLKLDDELATFVEAEVKRLRTSGRAGYLTQLITAAYLARQGDMSLVGLFSQHAASSSAPPPKNEPPPYGANTSAVDDAVGGMF